MLLFALLQNLFKSNLSLYSLYYAETCNEFAGPISPLLRVGRTALFKEIFQRWRTVGNSVFDCTGPRFEPQTSAPETNALPLDLLAGNKSFEAVNASR